jgi:hypothetical protein
MAAAVLICEVGATFETLKNYMAVDVGCTKATYF